MSRTYRTSSNHNCKTKSGIISMEDCIKDVIENKTKYFIIIYKDSTGEYGNVLDLEDLKDFLRKYHIAAYINLWKGDGHIPFYFTEWIIHYINRHEKDKIKYSIPNILIVEKKSSWLSLVGWSDYFDIHFADYENGDVTPIKDQKRIHHINYTEDDKKRIGKTLHEFVPKETKMVEPPPIKLKEPEYIPRKNPSKNPSKNPYDYDPFHKRSVEDLGAYDMRTSVLGKTTWSKNPDDPLGPPIAVSGFGKDIFEEREKAERAAYDNNRLNWTKERWAKHYQEEKR